MICEGLTSIGPTNECGHGGMSSAKAAAYLMACRKYTLHSREDVMLQVDICLKIALSTCVAIKVRLCKRIQQHLYSPQKTRLHDCTIPGQTSLGDPLTEHILLSREIKGQYYHYHSMGAAMMTKDCL